MDIEREVKDLRELFDCGCSDSDVVQWLFNFKARVQSDGVAVPEGWTIERESEDRITIESEGIGFYVAKLNSDRISEIMLYALANDLLGLRLHSRQPAAISPLLDV